ncbi:MAG: phosphoglucosamine mutase [Nitrososphaera sp.]
MQQKGEQNGPRLFGTNGVRGVYGSTINHHLVIDLVRALASYFRNGPIVVGYDGRHSSPTISKLVRATLNSAGIRTADAGLLPTPCLQFAAKKLGYSGGIMVTASHNPPEYNGLKPSGADGVEISREDELAVEKAYYDKVYPPVHAHAATDSRDESVVPAYIDAALALVDSDRIRNRKFTIVMDTGNGAQAAVAPLIARHLGCKVIVVNGRIDGDFPARGSEPLVTNLSILTEAVKSSRADLGVAFDGDGDRSIFCDEKGAIHWGDKTGALLTRHLISTRHPGAEVVCPINTSMVLESVTKEAGGRVFYTKVGSVEVSREMVARGSPLGLEENGGYMYGPMNQVRDGAMSTCLVLDMLAASASPFSGLVAGLPRTYQFKDKFSCNSRASVESVVRAVLGHGSPRRIEQMDGAKIWIDDESWVMVRPSGTEPLIRMYAESTDKSLLDSKVEEYRRVIVSTIGGMQDS